MCGELVENQYHIFKNLPIKISFSLRSLSSSKIFLSLSRPYQSLKLSNAHLIIFKIFLIISIYLDLLIPWYILIFLDYLLLLILYLINLLLWKKTLLERSRRRKQVYIRFNKGWSSLWNSFFGWMKIAQEIMEIIVGNEAYIRKGRIKK